MIEGAAALEAAEAGELSFVSSPKYFAAARASAAGCLIGPPEYEESGSQTILESPQPRAHFAAALQILYPAPRLAPGIDPNAMVDVLKAAASRITAQAQTMVPEARVEIVEVNSYPGLDTSPTQDAVDFVRSFHPDNEVLKLAFGTEGGLFTARLGVPVVVCGPGSITQAHKPDEFVEAAQLDQCDAFLAKLLGQLQAS